VDEELGRVPAVSLLPATITAASAGNGLFGETLVRSRCRLVRVNGITTRPPRDLGMDIPPLDLADITINGQTVKA